MRKFLMGLLAAMLLLASMTALCEALPAVQPGDVSEDALSVQTELARLCYYTGGLTGHYGEATKAAVAAFQADFGLEVTGVADENTRAALSEASWRPLSFGDAGEDVKRLQTQLTRLGYYKGKISGNYLATTGEALSAFQEKMGLIATGEADVNTLTLLYGDDARTSQQSALKAAATATPEPTEEVSVSDGGATPAPGDAAATNANAVPYSKKLQYGDTGDLVKQLQQRLQDLSYYGGNISGNYLGNTRNAVKSFQQQNGLDVDGIVGEKTWNALFNAESIVPPDATPKPTAAPASEAFYIVVDVTNQVTTVYGRDENGDYTQVIKQMLCSTGTKKNPSDLGDWTLSGRKATWCYFPEWGSHARYWTRINSSIAFHSVIYNSVNTMDLSVSSYNNLGKRASHGCIRLTVADAKWIYDNVDAGTVVHITDSLPADPELVASLKLPSLNKSNMLPYATSAPTQEPMYVSGARPPMPLTELKKNDSGEAVYWLQKKLTELGYYTGKCSGTYLAGTQDAVKAFQADQGLRTSGTATVETLTLLYQQELATPAPTDAPTVTPGIIATPEAVATPSPSPAPTDAPGAEG